MSVLRGELFPVRKVLALVVLTGALGVAGCSSTQTVVSDVTKPLSSGKGPRKSASGPMFPESKWGVSASKRKYAEGERIPKGGGTYKIGAPYQVGGRWYEPREQTDYDRVGIASWYGSDFHGRHTANGEIFDMDALTAAHPTLPMPSFAYVTNLSNNRTILVRINDRGPYVGERVIDLSRKSADALGLRSGGTGKVRVRYAGRAPLDGSDHHERRFLASRGWSGGHDIAALESEQSAREVAAYHGARQPGQSGVLEQRPLAPLRREMAAEEAAPRAGYERSYAEAGPAEQRVWTPHEYRAALTR